MVLWWNTPQRHLKKLISLQKIKTKKPQFIQEFKLLQRKTQLLYNGILLSHKKEPIWVSYNEVNESIAYYTEWSMSERQTLYINAYIWHLERQYWWTNLQGSNGNRAIEKRLWTRGGGKESMGWIETVVWKHTYSHMQNGNGNSLHDSGSSNWCFVAT